MTDVAELRADAAKDRSAAGAPRTALPNGDGKRGAPDQRIAFPRPPEFRAELIQRDGLDYFMVEGYASMTERSYEMYDFFGPYQEVVTRSAFDKTLAASPDVVFRFNHGGMPMANTNDNKRLELWADAVGLGTRAYLNPKRREVQDLIHAIEDRDVREQSFMFQIESGEWSDDYTEFRIDVVDLDRGDVGPVTYGANPNTLIAARSGELLAVLPQLSTRMAREALTLLTAREDIAPLVAAVEPVVVPFDVVAKDSAASALSPRAADTGVSIRLALAQLEVDRQH